MKIISIIGARPQFIKAAPISRLIRPLFTEIILHTGQHYDKNLSKVFFEELGIPDPDYNLGVGSGSHGVQTGKMLVNVEKVLIDENPDWVLVYGDTNSTLAGALAAVKLNIRIAHIEAGLRSFNRRMPEEINRVLTDHMSDLLFCPSDVGLQNLANEGITEGVVVVGDVMVDSLAYAAERAKNRSRITEALNIISGEYYLATVHRANNTKDPQRLKGILKAFAVLDAPVIFPIHPRTLKAIEDFKLDDALMTSNIKIIEPIGYLDMVQLEQSAKMILTDSGGIQKEAYWLKVPCVTLRDETEWVETVHSGWNVLAGADADKIVNAIFEFKKPNNHPEFYGDGQAGQRIVDFLLKFME